MSKLHITNRGAGVLLAIALGFVIACGMSAIGTFDSFVWMP